VHSRPNNIELKNCKNRIYYPLNNIMIIYYPRKQILTILPILPILTIIAMPTISINNNKKIKTTMHK
jgi:hypothetical protein